MKTQISLNIETEKNSIYKSDSQNIPKVNLTDLLYRKKTEDKKKIQTNLIILSSAVFIILASIMVIKIL